MNKSKSELFDGPNTPLVYSSGGVNMDFVKHKLSEIDADMTADEMEAAVFSGGPIICLEKSVTITGGSQVLVYTAPSDKDSKIVTPARLIGVELAIQLNELKAPKTDFSFDLNFRNVFGDILEGMRQTVTGNASITGGNTRQYLRFIPFVRHASCTADGTIDFEDGKDPIFPLFTSVDPLDIVADGSTVATRKLAVPAMRDIIAAVELSIPAGSMAADVIVTMTPITSGRLSSIAEMITALDKVGAANSRPADGTDTSAKLVI